MRRPLPLDNTFAWAIVAVPLLSLLLPLAFPTISGGMLGLAMVVLNVVFAVADDKRVQAAGYVEVGALWGLILVPVYLVLRARRVGMWAIPLLWGVSFLVYLAVLSAVTG